MFPNSSKFYEIRAYFNWISTFFSYIFQLLQLLQTIPTFPNYIISRKSPTLNSNYTPPTIIDGPSWKSIIFHQMTAKMARTVPAIIVTQFY